LYEIKATALRKINSLLKLYKSYTGYNLVITEFYIADSRYIG